VSGHQGLEGSDPAARGEILQQRQFIGDAALPGSVGHATPMPQRRHWLQSNRGYMSNSGQRRCRSLWSGSCTLWQSLSTAALGMDAALRPVGATNPAGASQAAHWECDHGEGEVEESCSTKSTRSNIDGRPDARSRQRARDTHKSSFLCQ